MANRYWVGGTGAWSNVSTANWSTSTGLSFTASCTGTALTTTGSPALVAGMTVWSSTHVSLGTIVSGAVNTWVVSVGGTYASQSMSAATVGASVPTATDSVFFDANSNSSTTAFTVTMSVTPRLCNDFTASGLDGVMTLAGTAIGLTVSGSLTFQATNFTRTYTGATIFNATTTGKTVTTNGVAFGGAVTFNGVGGAWALGSALTTSTTITTTLTNGTLDLQSYTLSTGLFSSSNSNTRTIAFGTGQISCTGTGTVWTTSTVTGLTTTGTQVVNVTSTGSTAITVTTGTLSEANSISYNFTGGTYALTFLNGALASARNVNFTGYAGTLGSTGTAQIYGNLTLSSAMTLTSSGNATSFRATSGTQTITSNGKPIPTNITINGNSATTVTCADALTISGIRALTLSLGTLKLAAGTTNTVYIFITSGTTLKYLQSTTPGTQATISDVSGGTNTVTYLSIQDSAATGGATWDATSATNIDAGNNSGWTFGAAPTATGNFLMFF